MVLQSFEALKQQLSVTRKTKKRVIVVNPTDEHTLSAVIQLYQAEIIIPVLIGSKSVIDSRLEKMGIPEKVISALEMIDISGDEAIADKAVSFIRSGKGDVLMKGHIQTRDLLKAVVKKETGIRKQAILSHVAINEIPYYHKLLFVTDGGMILTPDIEMKQAILKNVLTLTQQLGYQQTNVAILDATENGNPKLQVSRDASELKARSLQGAFEGAVVEGPISLDLSLNKDIAEEKNYVSPVAGEADVLLVPDIVSGNLLGKSMMTFGQGKMAGLILGATVPIVITSRGSTTEEKINSLVIACAMSA
ncbi:phosphate acyltransferase [Listeria ilorinensis]|uniref:phosphate acyltransferase n=1 Tax=Listeria ilorinensis TaxID=2867439 RepID=UPI001EF63F6E|nr:phosphate acyltransferase [Listeria ilorinensis]